jgi:hypothetical protein
MRDATSLREYIKNLRNELEWDGLVQKTQNKLVQTARQARQDIAAGKAKPMDYNQL